MRRTDSTSSASIDPFVSHHAEAAAVSAYQRAHPRHERQAMQSKLQRHRSQKSIKTEGSHFDDARFGRRQSQKIDGARAKPGRPLTYARPPEDRAVTHTTSLPLDTVGLSIASEWSSPPPSGRMLRKRASAYTEGSPEPRHAQTTNTQRPTSFACSGPDAEQSGTTYANVTSATHLATIEDATSRNEATSATHSVNKPPAEADALAQARDKCLHDFQQKRVRERKSFLLAPFQRRKITGLMSMPRADDSLPPFNYADDTDLSLMPTSPQLQPVPIIRMAPPQSRKLSESLTDRLKKVFRRPSKPIAVEIPPQHIEAKDFRWTIKDCDMTEDTVAYDDFTDPFMTIASEQPHVPKRCSGYDSTKRDVSAYHADSAESRVTSWTNSSMADTSTFCSKADPCVAQEEDGIRSPALPSLVIGKRSSNTTLRIRKVSSFFGRAQSRLHDISDANAQSSPESRGLYDALQKRMNLAESEPMGIVEPSKQQDLVQSIRAAGCMTPDTRTDPQQTYGVFSPTSVYSRATDGQIDGPEMPEDVGIITVTGREVKRYSISQPKTTQSAKPSGDWRRWLSNEFSHFGFGLRASSGGSAPESSQPPAVKLPENTDAAANSGSSQKQDERASSRSSEIAYRLPRPPARPRTESRSSSYMNERYPMVSNHEHGSRNASSSRAKSRHGEDAASRRRQSSAKKDPPLPSVCHKSIGRVASDTREAVDSTSVLENTVLSATANCPPEECAPMPRVDKTRLSIQPITKPGHVLRPKSAHELRVKYKNGVNGAFRPLEIRRRKTQTFDHVEPKADRDLKKAYAARSDLPRRLDTINSISTSALRGSGDSGPCLLNFRLEEDPTLINISAGPYAKNIENSEFATIQQPQTRPISAQPSQSLSIDRGTLESTPRQFSHNQQENHRPLESLPKAKWLNDGRKSITPTMRFRSGQRSTQPSPGQRLATGWLDEREPRRLSKKESTPTFI